MKTPEQILQEKGFDFSHWLTNYSVDIIAAMQEYANQATGQRKIGESVEEAAGKRFPLIEDWAEIDKYIIHSKRHGFLMGAGWQSKQGVSKESVIKLIQDRKDNNIQNLGGKHINVIAEINMELGILITKIADN